MSPSSTANNPEKPSETLLTPSNPGASGSAADTTSYSPVSALEEQESHTELPQHRQQIHDGEKLIPPHHVQRKALWARFRGKTRATRIPGVVESLKAILFCSLLNVFLLLIPFAWAAHFNTGWSNDRNVVFSLCFLSTIGLEGLLDFGGEQMSLYCGKELGDLITVTLNNTVEATLAIILLFRCNLKLLQSTISGVVLLHLLFVPGVAFLAGGARIWHQNLQAHTTELNHTLLTIGILALLLPAAFFAALNPGVSTNTLITLATKTNSSLVGTGTEPFINDTLRGNFLSISRGMAIILLIVYICSRIFLFNPPGDGNALTVAADAPEEVRRIEHELAHEAPKVNPWVCLGLLIGTVAVTATTAEFLVASVEAVLENSSMTLEWFGVVLLPLVSFSGDATVAVIFFVKTALFLRPKTPDSLARGQSIDLAIQFTLFWMPFLVLLGWWSNRPLTLLFDLFEVATLVGAGFLVNYVTADSKTNWAEGVSLCALYIMIALVTWFYEGQVEIFELLGCESVAATVRKVAEGGSVE
ncbi:hypothetical protein K439DRAFT_1413364 [Ramaria rubella]|nr:hypothetical protein K439DRAFT_1413364 [Ramaria rubella]